MKTAYVVMISFALWISVVTAAGCIKESKADLKTQQIIRTFEQAEPVIIAFEDATGRGLPESIVSRGEKVSGIVETIGKTGSGIAVGVGQPSIAALLGLIGTIAGACGTFFQRRRAAAVARAAVAAADELDNGGKTLVAAAQVNGCADYIHEVYQATQ
jgi:hypothetical protein